MDNRWSKKDFSGPTRLPNGEPKPIDGSHVQSVLNAKLPDQSDFIGRTRELDKVIRNIQFPSGPGHSFILGERGIGKTTLLAAVQKECGRQSNIPAGGDRWAIERLFGSKG